MTPEQLDIQLKSYMQNVPGAIHGVVLNVENMNDANKLYFSLEEAYNKMLQDLVDNKFISEISGDLTTNFATVGFPRFVHQLTQLSHVMLFISNDKQKHVWTVEIIFHYKADSSIVYRTQILP